MRTIELGRGGPRVSAVGLGTWAYGGLAHYGGQPEGWSGHDDAAAAAALARAHARGIVHWDTADVYGKGAAERIIGSAWGGVPRGDVVLASKVGWLPLSERPAYHPGEMRRSLEESLRNLRTDYLDLYYLHHCDFGPGDALLAGAVEQMHAFRREGLVRHVGLSDWDCAKVLRYAPAVDPDVVQVPRNVLEDAYAASGLKAWVEANGKGAVFFSVLKQGVLLGKYAAVPAFEPGDVRAKIPAFGDAGFLRAARRAREAVEARFPGRAGALLGLLAGALTFDYAGAAVLIGIRDPAQADAAAEAGEPVTPEDAAFARELYSRAVAAGSP